MRVTDNDDERTSLLFHSRVACLHQFAADALALVVRMNGHRPERGALKAADNDRTVEDVADDVTVRRRHQREQHPVVVAQRVDDVAFAFLPERAPVHFLNGADVTRLLVTNPDWHRYADSARLPETDRRNDGGAASSADTRPTCGSRPCGPRALTSERAGRIDWAARGIAEGPATQSPASRR